MVDHPHYFYTINKLGLFCQAKRGFFHRGAIPKSKFQWETTHITNNQADTDQFICIENASEKRGVHAIHTHKKMCNTDEKIWQICILGSTVCVCVYV